MASARRVRSPASFTASMTALSTTTAIRLPSGDHLG
ncbi:hypothetical protein SACE_4186 [Saccharopolyspora erythraea NRRL 2338]|uniref:Uncharacterized protein n=1 Tax=Saccharopolyspora erythraea (strain ATCC 11635 / DSM 40517 / JCM 4748 / NBRC 13426 / NCIMB 8594 / NRRL 2338) TaxID=405948 RepID=A4FHD0_SACEN|nr:hypothetical protein N599_07430 [Saccharopolyspora erythraea D]CAM03455.1 hypothetical protein SACE_4186 [Saccharopolyspora erythraea NRRL 2338]